ncbi:MAG: hypothetical protein AABZ53_05975 [Planctomycetota bacterium]
MKRTTTALGLAMTALLAGGCQTDSAARGVAAGKAPVKGPFVTRMGQSITSNGFTPLYPLLVSGVAIQSSDAGVFSGGDPAKGTVDFTSIVMPHPTRSDQGAADPNGPRTVSFTPYNSAPALRLQNGILYMTGRWRVPATIRVKGGHDGASMSPVGTAAGEPEGSAQYDGILLVWVSNDEEWWFWQPTSGTGSLALSLPGSQSPTTDVIPARSYVRLKNTGGGVTIAETHPFNNGTVAHEARVVEVFNAALTTAGAAGLPQMDKLQP